MLAVTLAEPDPAAPIYLHVMSRARAGRAMISLIAESAHGASDPASIGLQIAAAAAAKAAPPQPRLFVLAVGVARYKQKPPDDLKYAARDAEDVANFFLRQKGRLYRDVSAQALMDTDATREAITDGILWLLDHVSADDVIMIFFSGHGVVERDVYYFLSHDASSQTSTKLSITAIDQQAVNELNCFKTLFDKQAKVYAYIPFAEDFDPPIAVIH
jgi:Caspase domain